MTAHQLNHIEYLKRTTKDPVLAAKKVSDYRRLCYKGRMGYKEFG